MNSKRFISFDFGKNKKSQVSVLDETGLYWIGNIELNYFNYLVSSGKGILNNEGLLLLNNFKIINNSLIKKPTLKNIFIEYKGKCCFCNKQTTLFKEDLKDKKERATLEHIIPQSNGGKNMWSNLVLACQECNNIKSNKPLSKSGLVLREKIKKSPEFNTFTSGIPIKLAKEINVLLK